MNIDFYNPNKANILEKIVASLLYRAGTSRFISSRIVYAGEIVDFSNFVRSVWGGVKLRISREQIWQDIESNLLQDVVFLEFGVASGYLTFWWLNPEKKRLIASGIRYEYHGFDSFEGLPRDWRNFPRGSFSTNGNTPNIEDPYLQFHVGLVENSFQESFMSKLNSKSQLIIFFDLDLFEPSLHVYSVLKSYLKPGDILYFDEARDMDERNLLQKYIVKDFDLLPISVSYSNIAFSIVKKLIN